MLFRSFDLFSELHDIDSDIKKTLENTNDLETNSNPFNLD